MGKGRRWLRALWLVWCGGWALAWLAAAAQSLIDYGQYSEPGAGMDLLINLALCGGSVALMWAGKPKRGAAVLEEGR